MSKGANTRGFRTSKSNSVARIELTLKNKVDKLRKRTSADYRICKQ